MENTNTNEITMVRYGRVNGVPKNTLFTIKNGAIIYFGISRCCMQHDHPNKEIGKFIASERASLVKREMADATIDDMVIHRGGFRGAVPTDKIIDLLKYFDNIDQVMYEQRGGDWGVAGGFKEKK